MEKLESEVRYRFLLINLSRTDVAREKQRI